MTRVRRSKAAFLNFGGKTLLADSLHGMYKLYIPSKTTTNSVPFKHSNRLISHRPLFSKVLHVYNSKSNNLLSCKQDQYFNKMYVRSMETYLSRCYWIIGSWNLLYSPEEVDAGGHCIAHDLRSGLAALSTHSQAYHHQQQVRHGMAPADHAIVSVWNKNIFFVNKINFNTRIRCHCGNTAFSWLSCWSIVRFWAYADMPPLTDCIVSLCACVDNTPLTRWYCVTDQVAMRHCVYTWTCMMPLTSW